MMRKQLKMAAVFAAAAALALYAAPMAEAAEWKQDENGWWVDNGDGSYPSNCWYQSPASGLWYYMDADGYMLTDAATPDGERVGADGVWIQGTESQAAGTEDQAGTAERKYVEARTALCEADFLVWNPDGTTYDVKLNNDAQNDGAWWFYWYNDDAATNRGITFGNTIWDVEEAYGTTSVVDVSEGSDEVYCVFTRVLDSEYFFPGEGFLGMMEGRRFADYKMGTYGLRFYFDNYNNVSMILYYNDLSAMITEQMGSDWRERAAAEGITLSY